MIYLVPNHNWAKYAFRHSCKVSVSVVVLKIHTISLLFNTFFLLTDLLKFSGIFEKRYS